VVKWFFGILMNMYSSLLLPLTQLLKSPRIFIPLFLLAGTGSALVGLHTPSTPLPTTTFVLLASSDLRLESGTQVSSGNLGSNDKLKLEKDVLVSGHLFAQSLELKEHVVIDGNATYHKLKKASSASILGTETRDTSSSLALFPSFPSSTQGTTSLTITATSTLSPGVYQDITILEGSTLTIEPGTYHMRSLVLKDHATVLYSGSTTIHITDQLQAKDHVAVLPKHSHIPHDALTIQYSGLRSKHAAQADDTVWESDTEKRDFERGKIGRPIQFGSHVYLSLVLLAPQGEVKIGKESTILGQVMGKKVKVGKGSVVSRENVFAKVVRPSDILEGADGSQFVKNHILIDFSDGLPLSEVREIIQVVNGRIIGFIDVPNVYNIEVSSGAQSELEDLIFTLRNLHHSQIEAVWKNYITDVI
jgi:cytoskeletal protein CcmA (bactofilin family)